MTGARMTGRRKIVIGDSLAGLTVALAPRHAGFEVDDFERSARKSAAGAPASRWLPIGRRRYRRHQHKEQRPVGAVPDKYEPFDREDFAPWRGARRMAMHLHRQRRATMSTGQKHPACGGSNRLPGGVAVLARCEGIALRTAPTRKTDLFPSN